MDKVGWAKRIKQVNNFSDQVNTMIEIMSKNKCGIYNQHIIAGEPANTRGSPFVL